MTIEELIVKAEKDRYSLIIEECDEAFARAHINEIYRAYPCTGILVKDTVGGVGYHETKTQFINSILSEGLRANSDENATFGDGVVYLAPNLEFYNGMFANNAAMLKVVYGPGALRAIFTEDKEDWEQGEVIVPPDCIIKVELLANGRDEVLRLYKDATKSKFSGVQPITMM